MVVAIDDIPPRLSSVSAASGRCCGSMPPWPLSIDEVKPVEAAEQICWREKPWKMPPRAPATADEAMIVGSGGFFMTAPRSTTSGGSRSSRLKWNPCSSTS